MDLIYLLVLGFVQALTEFIPVSSSGHLILIDELTPIESSLIIDVALHVGTLIALIYYYRKYLLRIIKDIIEKRNSHLLMLLIIATIPAGIMGFFFADLFESLRTTPVVLVMLMLVGIIMVCERWFFAKTPARKISELKWYHALAVGFAQALALVPGTSRSGISIIGGRWAGLSVKQAADFAFLIGIPAIAGAGFKVLLESEARGLIAENPLDIVFGVLITAVIGLFAIRFVLKFVADNGLFWFGVYRIALAVGIILLV